MHRAVAKKPTRLALEDVFDNLVGSLAQLVEQRTLNPRAKGSNPLRPMLRSVAHGLPSVLFSHHD